MDFQAEYLVLFDRIQIRYYGIIIVTAMLIGATVAARLAKRDGKDPDHIWGALTWALIPGIIFARLWYVLFPPVSQTIGCDTASLTDACYNTAYFFQNFFDLNNGAIAIWSGGLSIFGAFLGGLLGAYIYLRRNNLPMWSWLDIAGVVMPLGQAIGRIANFVNQELYGLPTTLPWGIQIDVAKRADIIIDPALGSLKSLIDYPVETLFHPLFLYEALWNVVAFIVLLSLFLNRRKQFRPGDIFLLYIMQYSVIRFLLEFLRVDVPLAGGVNISQVVCIIGFIVALVLFYLRRQEQPAAITAPKTAKRA